MEYVRFGSNVVVRVDRGEEVIEAIKKVIASEHIALGTLSGIGAVNAATIGIFLQDTKQYCTTQLSGNMEIVNLSGNISQMEGKPYIHAHVTLTDEQYQAHGGHLNAAIVGATVELVITCIEGAIDRRFDNEVGLNLMKFL
jgi:predicted DNA-binding protein with PD1-like motif